MNNNVGAARKISWALIISHIFLAAHFGVVFSAQNSLSKGSMPVFGILGTIDVIGTSAIIPCGWTKCMDGDPRTKPLISVIALGGIGSILLGLLVGSTIDRLSGRADTSAKRAGAIALASLLVGILGYVGLRPAPLEHKLHVLRVAPKPMSANQKLSEEHYLAGLEFFKQRDYEKAAVEWKEALKADPDNKNASRALQRVQTPTKALPASSCDGSSDKPSPKYAEGLIHFQKQDYEGARKLWKEAVREQPNDCEANAGLAKLEKMLAGDN